MSSYTYKKYMRDGSVKEITAVVRDKNKGKKGKPAPTTREVKEEE